MDKIRRFIQCFVTVTTGIVAIGAITYSLQPTEPTSDTLWQILLSGALCALSTTLFFPSEFASKARIRAGIGLHFISLCAIMVCCGRWFGWVGPTVLEAAIMVGYVVLVYAFTTGITYLLSKRQADEINRHLREKYHTQDAQEEK